MNGAKLVGIWYHRGDLFSHLYRHTNKHSKYFKPSDIKNETQQQ